MTTPCVVIATFSPLQGELEAVREVLTAIIPEVHQEEGCELYSLHEEVDGKLTIIEMWSTRELWRAHSALDTVKRLQAGVAGRLENDVEVWEMYGIPAGDATKGAL